MACAALCISGSLARDLQRRWVAASRAGDGRSCTPRPGAVDIYSNLPGLWVMLSPSTSPQTRRTAPKSGLGSDPSVPDQRREQRLKEISDPPRSPNRLDNPGSRTSSTAICMRRNPSTKPWSGGGNPPVTSLRFGRQECGQDRPGHRAFPARSHWRRDRIARPPRAQRDLMQR